MRTISLSVALIAVIHQVVLAQGVIIGEGIPDPSSILELGSSSKGFLTPRITESERDAIANPAVGLLIFNTTSNCFNYRTSTGWAALCGLCTPDTEVASHPESQSGCTNGSVQFTALGSGNDLTYSWEVSSNNGVSWNTIDNGPYYTGATSPTLTISNPSVAWNGYRYRAAIAGNCPPSVFTECCISRRRASNGFGGW